MVLQLCILYTYMRKILLKDPFKCFKFDLTQNIAFLISEL